MSYIKNQYKNSTAIIKIELNKSIAWRSINMVNLGLEIIFWLILLIYIIARLIQNKKVFKFGSI